MTSNFLSKVTLAAGGLLACGLPVLQAAPTVTRLNPPSGLFSFGDALPPYISRFAQGQRFDLHATITADAGQSITSASFTVDNVAVPGTVTVTKIGSTDRYTAVLRAYASVTPGVKVLKVTANQSGGLTAAATGNFQIVPVDAVGGAKKAKNIILFIGDGTGIAHRTAARIVSKGVQMGKAIDPLAIDTLPYTGIVMTPSLNSVVTDSAPGAACYSTGNKSNNNQEGVFPDDTTATGDTSLNKWDNPRVEHLGSFLARTQGKALGIVTTADVEDATPASFGTHAQDRGAGTGICDMFLDEATVKSNLRVLMGGGRKWFIPFGSPGSGRVGDTTSTGADYTLPQELATGWGVPVGVVDPARDLIGAFQTAGFQYAPDVTTLNAIPSGTTKLLGLFHTGNMDVALDKIAERRGGPAVGTVSSFPDQPMLDEMTEKALQVLNNNAKGFFLMVEGASIDKQAHNMDSERWILEAIEFDRAVAKAIAFQQSNPDTLIVVTADHECGGINIIGATTITDAQLVAKSTQLGTDGVAGVIDGATGPSTDGQKTLRTGVVGTYDAASFPVYNILPDGYPETMDVNNRLLIGYAASGDRYEDWRTNPQPNVNPATRDTAGDFFIVGQATQAGVSSAVHTASDIPLSAGGRCSSLFTGVMDNTDVFFKIVQAVLGGAKKTIDD
ncbi:MAG: alkaline phosphatase [Verrucomicrobium sp.]